MSELADRTESLFAAAVALPSEARAAYLDEACAGDKELLARLHALLRAHDHAGHLLDRPMAADQTAGYVNYQPGVVIAGRYKLLEEIGEGGMGSVWVAEQTEPVRRKVALKLIKAGMDSKSVLARFEAERQALAVMDHPNIAKVLDGGLTETGRPFFVMEYVKGVPITEYCDATRLSVPERLNLFVQVCHAVQHAHQKGIIHRDLKPSNILVAPYDDKPVPKVIDFGLAKAMHQSLTERTLHTAHETVLGTPLYMSPEQAQLNNLDVDTRSDIYSLGVLLYELLTGTTPLEKQRFKEAAWDEIKRLIREEEPPRPSTRLSSSHTLASLAAGRQMEPARLTKLVRGELDWIVMKSLEKDRSRRYETANGFAIDVQRYLTGEPVLAAPPSATYRLRKFARKHRAGLTTAAAIALFLVAGAAVSTWQAIRATRAEFIALQAQQAEAERAEGERLAKLEAQAQKEQAQKRLSQIEKANTLLGSIFHNLDPREIARAERPLQAILVEKLDQAVSQLEGESIGDPLVVAQMQHNFAVSLMSLGEPAKAIVLLKKAIVTREATGSPDDQALLASKNVLAVAYRDTGKLDLALPLLEETFNASQAKYGPEHFQTLTCRNNLAQAYGDLGKHDLAVPFVEETLRLSRAVQGPKHEHTLQTMNALACMYQAAGKSDLALPLWEETLNLMKTELGPTHPTTLATMQSLGSGYHSAGKTDRSIPLMEEALKNLRAKLGSEHPETLFCMNSLAVIYRTVGRLDQSIALFEELLKLRKAKFSPDDATTLSIMNGLGFAFEQQRRYDRSMPLREELLKLTKAKQGPDHHDTLRVMNNLAVTYWELNKLDKSIPLFEETLRRKTATLGPKHHDRLKCMANLGVNYTAAGRLTEAIPLLEEPYRGASNLPELKQYVGPHLLNAYQKAGEHAKVVGLLLEELPAARKAAPKDSPELAVLLATISLSLLEQKKYAEAESLLRECLAIREKTQPDAWTTFNTKSMLGGALLGQKKYADAEPLLLAGYEGMKAREKTIPAIGSTRIPEAIDRLVQLYEALGKKNDAARWRKELEASKAAQRKPEKQP